jgi:2-polyprenyl-6-hydroxyphenyl methylase/3-demethylubiquinone-9 3-methyltransferase
MSESGARFEFGRNWARFLNSFDDKRRQLAIDSLKSLLNTYDLAGKTFVDAGCGSGVFSLAAEDLGAARIHSFDYDTESVACAERVHSNFSQQPLSWTIERGDCLDTAYMEGLGTFDVVYSWGVLHHTGDIWAAVDNTAKLVAPGGILAIALYNDQGWRSQFWTQVKKSYCHGPIGRIAVISLFLPWLMVRGAFHDALRGENPFKRYREPTARGMVHWRDYFDWLGGFPFEAVAPSQVHEHMGAQGFKCIKMKTVGRGSGCNEYLFRNRLARSEHGILAGIPTRDSDTNEPNSGSDTRRPYIKNR